MASTAMTSRAVTAPVMSMTFEGVGDVPAEAGAGADKFADDGAGQGEADADLGRGEQPGDERWDDEVVQHLPAAGPHAAEGIDEVGVDAFDALAGVEQHDDEDDGDGEQHLRQDADAEPDDEEGAEATRGTPLMPIT